MYKAVKVHIPQELHEKLKSLVAQDKVMPVKIDLRGGDDIILLTPGQIIKMEQAKNNGKKSTIFRVSRRQVRANVRHEGGFLSALMAMAKFCLLFLLD